MTGCFAFCLLDWMDAQMVIFRLAGQRLALPTAAVRECLPLPELWQRPGLPAPVAGFFSLGGVVLPVVDLAVLLGLRTVDRPDGTTFATGRDEMEQGGLYRPLLHVGAVAFLVDSLEAVEAPDEQDPDQEGSESDRWQHGCVARHLFVSGRPVALLDPSRLLLAEESDRLAMLTREADERARGWAAPAGHDAV